MKTINRLMTNICSDKLAESKYFYTKLFDFQVNFDSDWFVHLRSKDQTFEIGIIERTHQIVPKAYQNHPQGFYITLVVDNADDVFKMALKENFEIIAKPSDTAYGQRRFLLKDPNGMLLDVSSLIPNFEF